MPKARRLLCHDCLAVLTTDDRRHYAYQCHACVVIEHDLIGLASRDPEHPELNRLRGSAVHLGRSEPGLHRSTDES